MYGAIKAFTKKFSRELTLLGLILALGAGLRIARINYDSLTFDEQWHLELSTGRGSPHVTVGEDKFIPIAPAATSLVDAPPWYAVWTHMDYVVHPPLYCTLLRLWRNVFGEGDIAARAFSILLSLIAIALMFFAAWELNGLSTAAWAALIFAVAPTQVFLAQQVRGYELLLVLGMGAMLALARLEKSPRTSLGSIAALGICVLGMMLTHYFSAGICVALGIYVLIRLRGARLGWTLGVLFVAVVVYAIIWGPYFYDQRQYFKETADPWLVENVPNHIHIVLTLGRLATAPWRLAVDVVGEGFSPALLAGVIVLAPLVFFAFKQRLDLLVWYLWLAGTLGFLAGLDLMRDTKHLFFARYLSPASPAVFVLFAGMLPRRFWTQHVFSGALVLTGLLCSSFAYQSEEPDWRKLGQEIDQNVKPDQTLVFYPALEASWKDEIYYLGSAHYSHVFPHPIARLSRPADPELIRQFPGDTAWLVSGPLVPRPPFFDPRAVESILPGMAVVGEPIVIPDLVIITQVKKITPVVP